MNVSFERKLYYGDIHVFNSDITMMQDNDLGPEELQMDLLSKKMN